VDSLPSMSSDLVRLATAGPDDSCCSRRPMRRHTLGQSIRVCTTSYTAFGLSTNSSEFTEAAR